MQLPSRRCLLTGASGGIGRAVALELAGHGVELVLSGRRGPSLQALADEIESHGGRAAVIVADLLEPGGPEQIVAATLRSNPTLDLLVNCAGVAHFATFEDTPPQVLESLLRINVLAPMRLTQAALPALRQSREALVVNVGSIFGSIGFPCFTAYSATKFALRGFSEALRREIAGSTVGVLYFAPRYTCTALNADNTEQMAAALGMARDRPQEVAQALVRDIQAKLRERYLGWPEKFFVRLNALWPRLVDGALIKQSGRMRPYALQRLA